MRKSLVPVLLLTTIALSSSKLLPILSMQESKPDQRFTGQPEDNTYRKLQTRNRINDILFKIENKNPSTDKELYQNKYYKVEDNINANGDDDNYDVNGFRKAQWHNYPRQLDRLNQYISEHFKSDKRKLDPDDFGEYGDSADETLKDTKPETSNEYNLDDTFNSPPTDEANKAAAIMNPLIILKIHLACIQKDGDFSQITFDRTSDWENKLRRSENEDYKPVDENSKSSLVKVKREGTRLEIADSTQNAPKNRMNKRIFSLWSRLQTLNHKGHELQHRRHLYALYGLPDSEGGGVLTAETRATFMRPPGSPLRWG